MAMFIMLYQISHMFLNSSFIVTESEMEIYNSRSHHIVFIHFKSNDGLIFSKTCHRSSFHHIRSVAFLQVYSLRGPSAMLVLSIVANRKL
jgi:hypothetical protein